MTILRGEPEIGAAWNGKRLSIRGIATIYLLSVFAIIASNLYAGWEIRSTFRDAFGAHAAQMETTTRRADDEHRMIRVSEDRTACLLSMSAEERSKFRQTYHVGAFKNWCPWVEE